MIAERRRIVGDGEEVHLLLKFSSGRCAGSNGGGTDRRHGKGAVSRYPTVKLLVEACR